MMASGFASAKIWKVPKKKSIPHARNEQNKCEDTQANVLIDPADDVFVPFVVCLNKADDDQHMQQARVTDVLDIFLILYHFKCNINNLCKLYYVHIENKFYHFRTRSTIIFKQTKGKRLRCDDMTT